MFSKLKQPENWMIHLFRDVSLTVLSVSVASECIIATKTTNAILLHPYYIKLNPASIISDAVPNTNNFTFTVI